MTVGCVWFGGDGKEKKEKKINRDRDWSIPKFVRFVTVSIAWQNERLNQRERETEREGHVPFEPFFLGVARNSEGKRERKTIRTGERQGRTDKAHAK
jgi:hypothetical protein